MKNNFLKSAFTLAELMIAITIIAILAVVMLPNMNRITPSEALAIFKKTNTDLHNAIRELVTSDKYFFYGDLGTTNKGDLITDSNPEYFCNSLADLLKTKSVNCSGGGEGLNQSALASLSGIGTLAVTKCYHMNTQALTMKQ